MPFGDCPICKNSMRTNPLHPHMVCRDCHAMAASSDGRLLEFFITSLSGGYMARYADDKGLYESHACFIEGIECHAKESPQNGIVIEVGAEA